jgi:hypothetical protein
VPLTWHNSSIKLNGRAIPLTYNQDAQNWLEALRFDNGSSFEEVFYGRGHVFWAADPLELNESLQSVADVYAYVAGRVGVAPDFDAQAPIPLGVLVYPMNLQDAVLYIVTSDAATDSNIDVRDKATGVRVSLSLPRQCAALVLIDKQKKAVIGRYQTVSNLH